MEWRIFVPLLEAEAETESAVDIWRCIGHKSKSLFRDHAEKRTDTYIPCTEGVGLKLRGAGREMEIKVRGVVDANGVEQWHKLAPVGRPRVGTDIQQVFFEELKRIRTNAHLERECIESVDIALSTTWLSKMVSVSKQVTKNYVAGVSVEQSDLTVTVDRHITHWRTICVESHSRSKIQDMLSSEVKGDTSKISVGQFLRTLPNSVVQGYPLFVMRMSQD